MSHRIIAFFSVDPHFEAKINYTLCSVLAEKRIGKDKYPVELLCFSEVVDLHFSHFHFESFSNKELLCNNNAKRNPLKFQYFIISKNAKRTKVSEYTQFHQDKMQTLILTHRISFIHARFYCSARELKENALKANG